METRRLAQDVYNQRHTIFQVSTFVDREEQEPEARSQKSGARSQNKKSMRVLRFCLLSFCFSSGFWLLLLSLSSGGDFQFCDVELRDEAVQVGAADA
jgi:hypothetical protein